MAQIFSLDGITPVIHPSAFISSTATLIGDVLVGPKCYVGPGASLRGDMGRIVLEAGSCVQDGCLIHAGGLDTVVGQEAIVSHGAVLHGCTIKRNALIGIRAVIMDGAVIGEQAFVAAMSFVNADVQVPPRTLMVGVPAKVRRPVTDAEINFMTRGTLVYQTLAKRSLRTARARKPLRKATKKRLAQRISSGHGEGSGTPSKIQK
jgi:phenylacetic acid degradation protein